MSLVNTSAVPWNYVKTKEENTSVWNILLKTVSISTMKFLFLKLSITFLTNLKVQPKVMPHLIMTSLAINQVT